VLSIAAMSAGSAAYYASLAREDYFTEGGEPSGYFAGRGASALGLGGKVTKDGLRNLFAGNAPDDERPLVQSQRGKDHQPGWDLTFSATKSFSIAWALADEPLRAALEEVHRRAVGEAISYLEDTAAWSRRGRGGQVLERAGLVALLYEHGTSRAQDPSFHTHALVMNVGVRADGTTGTIRSIDLYRAKMTAGALYRSELARGVRELGFAVVKGKDAFELEDVPLKVRQFFSKRRAAIEEVLARDGITGPKAAEQAALSTRQKKGHVARGELFVRWKAEARELGLEHVQPDDRHRRRSQKEFELAPHVAAVVKELAEGQGHFSENDLLRHVAVQHEHRGVGARAVRDAVRSYLATSRDIEELADNRYSTKDHLDAEHALLDAATSSSGDRSHAIGLRRLRSIEKGFPTLSPEQRLALHHITHGSGAVKLLSGYAGSGKTTLLRAAREAWEAQGLTVVGAAVAKNAANALSLGSGIQSRTIASLRRALDQGKANDTGSHTRRVLGGVVRTRTRTPASTELGPRSVLVIDEASMASTSDLSMLVRAARKRGAKVVLVGDPGQLPAIDAGGAFAALSKAVGTAELRDIQRQREPWMREAALHFAEGDTRSGLSLYAEAGKINILDTRGNAKRALVKAWFEMRSSDPTQTLILAGTRADVSDLNRLAQAKRRQAGELGVDRVAFNGQTLHVGDRVCLTKNSTSLGLTNGDTGVLERVIPAAVRSRTKLVLRLDSGSGEPARRATIPINAYPHVELGYATTTHKAQGSTVDRTLVLAGGWMQDRELTYVQLTRHREDCTLFISEAEAGDDLAELARTMRKSHAKEMALAFEQEKQEVREKQR